VKIVYRTWLLTSIKKLEKITIVEAEVNLTSSEISIILNRESAFGGALHTSLITALSKLKFGKLKLRRTQKNNCYLIFLSINLFFTEVVL